MADKLKCSGRTPQGGLRKGFKLVKGEKCPIKASPKKKSKRGACEGIHTSGTKKGRLKKGFTWRNSNGGCPKKSKQVEEA